MVAAVSDSVAGFCLLNMSSPGGGAIFTEELFFNGTDQAQVSPVQIFIYIYMHTHTHIYILIYVYIYIYIYIYVYTHTHTHTHIYIYIYICVYICVCDSWGEDEPGVNVRTPGHELSEEPP